ncbi:MAG TPA: pirin family protein [Chitinophagaceae bacterium]|nr:pirin family protein [Chitinophagaceae bacterium]
MKTILHKADSRGHADHGWLNAHHSFSFAGYYDPERTHFGALRVLNDDIVAGGMGFGAHPHDNMEIITIPLSGQLEHKDSMGNTGVISNGEVQVMSAGTGIQHSEKNKNPDRPVNLLQIWVFPDTKNVKPRYDQKVFDLDKAKNNLLTIVSPMGEKDGLNIHQHAWFHLGKLDKDFSTVYELKDKENGVYAFVIDGSVTINGEKLEKKDGLGITGTDKLDIKADSEAELLLMEVPMF